MDKLSYAWGLAMGHQLKGMGMNSLNVEDFKDAVKSVYDGSEPAMNSINAARRNREAAEHEAEAAKIKLVAAAAAEAESKKLQGEGTANQRKAIARGIAESVQLLRECGVSEREANAILLATQYFDMQQSLGQNSNATTIFTPLSASGAGNTLNDIMGALAAFDNGKKSGNGPQE